MPNTFQNKTKFFYSCYTLKFLLLKKNIKTDKEFLFDAI